MTKPKSKKVMEVKLWAIKHLPSNEILLPICPTKDDAIKILFNNYVGPSIYFKVIRVSIKEIK